MKRGKTDCGYFALTVNLNQKTTAQCEWAVVLLYCTFVANIAIMTIIANKAKKNFFCICTMLNFHKHSSFLQSCPI